MHGFFKKILKSKALAFTGALLLVLSGALITAVTLSTDGSRGLAKADTFEGYDSGFVIAKPGTWDSEDTAVIKELDMENNSITLMNIETGRNYTLAWDGTTVLEDKYGDSMAMSQMEPGNIVDVNFLRGKKRLTEMKLSQSAWVFDNLEKYDVDILNKSVSIGDDKYSLQSSMVIISEEKEAQLEDIIGGDVVTVSGIGHNIYSIAVERGHGYLRLSDDEYLKGGWIEVGQKVIRQITDDMLLPVPEGTWDVHLTAAGIDETKQVTVGRNQEVVLDVSEVKAEEPKTGKILFAVTPGEAKLYIDGKEVDISSPVEMEYGIHQMIAKAEGYDSITQYIKVGQELASVSVILEKTEEDSAKETDTSRSVSGNELSGYYKVYIDAPSDVEVYVDGIYKGISPVNFKKEAGSHTITLRRKGYETKSYTVQIDDEEKDVTFSFTNLIKSEGTDVSGNSSSGKTTSGNSSSDKTTSGNSSDSDTVSGNGTTSGNSVSGN